MGARDAAAFLMFLGLFVFIGIVLYLVFEWNERHRKIKAQSEMNNRLLDKFASAQELIEFLGSPGSAQLLSTLSTDRCAPGRDILRAVQRGIILLLLGVGCFGLHVHYRSEDNPLLAFAVILSCLGIGFLLSGLVSHRLSESLGLSKPVHPQQ